MNLILTPKQAAPILRCDEKTIRNRIRRGWIKNVITNGASKNGVRYLIDMTKEYGIRKGEEVELNGIRDDETKSAPRHSPK